MLKDYLKYSLVFLGTLIAVGAGYFIGIQERSLKFTSTEDSEFTAELPLEILADQGKLGPAASVSKAVGGGLTQITAPPPPAEPPPPPPR